MRAKHSFGKDRWVYRALVVLAFLGLAAPLFAQRSTGQEARLAVSSVQSQNTSRTGVQQVVDEHSRAEIADIAEAIIVREEAASGRAFDPAFRARVKADLASLSPEALAAVETRASGLLPIPNIGLGSTQADLVYTPITPCRIIDTRSAGGPIAAGSTRNFDVAGTSLSFQGGSATGCGVPFGPATAAVINFVVVNPSGAGDLRQTPFGTPVPLASFLNYVNSGITNDNTANGSVTTICDPATTTCTFDFTIQVDNGATNLVADVMGYFAAPSTIPVGVCGTNDVNIGGHCYYLDGSAGKCDPGYAVVPQSVLSTIAASFNGLNYKHTISNNCCIYNSDPVDNWGMVLSGSGGHCNIAGPFGAGEPVLNGANCTGATNFQSAQLTLCGK